MFKTTAMMPKVGNGEKPGGEHSKAVILNKLASAGAIQNPFLRVKALTFLGRVLAGNLEALRCMDSESRQLRWLVQNDLEKLL